MSADVIVVGLGAVGSAVAHHLARHGARVLGIDRFRPPHTLGSSHGATRITRLAVGEGFEYVPIVQRSHALWRELEAETGQQLMLTTGGIVIAAPMADRLRLHGQHGFFERTVDVARGAGIEHEMLEADEVRRRFPAFLLSGDERAYYEPQAGILRPEACVAAQLQLAARHGAELRYDDPVLAVRSGSAGVVVETASGTLHAGQAVLATGAYLPAMLQGTDWPQRLAVQRQVLHWFATDEPDLYRPGVLPVFMRLHGGEGDQFYGFPMADGHAGVKVATEQMLQTTTPEVVDRVVSAEETRAMYLNHLAGRLRGVRDQAVHATTCLYTSTADGRFVVDRCPELANVTLVSACSGHGFKHSAGLGEAVAASVMGRPPAFDLSPFALAAQAWAR